MGCPLPQAAPGVTPQNVVLGPNDGCDAGKPALVGDGFTWIEHSDMMRLLPVASGIAAAGAMKWQRNHDPRRHSLNYVVVESVK
ncbi:MAG: hypothetical protein ACRYHQ_26630, partial [Janthinobacterium lividum]